MIQTLKIPERRKTLKSAREILRKRIANRVSRQSIRTCSFWSTKHRLIKDPHTKALMPFSFRMHPWAKEIHDYRGDKTGKKAAQMAYSETAINDSLFSMDILNHNIAYYLPSTRPDAYDFSTARFDPLLEESPHIGAMFNSTKNTGLKAAGSNLLYIRGLKSRSGAKSISVDYLIFDELDEMDPKLVKLCLERTSGQIEKRWFKLSTPTIKDRGIDLAYSQSSQGRFFFKCPRCSRFEDITHDNMVLGSDDVLSPRFRETHLICKQCKGKLDHYEKPNFLQDAEWVDAHKDRPSRGFHIGQYYSCVKEPWDVAQSYIEGLTDPTAQQEYYNSNLGEVHETEDARITDLDIEDCIGGFVQRDRFHSGFLTMGVDVGADLHYTIYQWTINGRLGRNPNARAKPRILRADTVKEFEDLYPVMEAFNIPYTVMDANPETRKAKEFAHRYFGKVVLCYYVEGMSGKDIKITDDIFIRVNRTNWMDQSLSRFKNRTIKLPKDLSLEFRRHVKSPVKVPQRDKRTNNIIFRYLIGENIADHFAHSCTYAEMALPLAATGSKSRNIRFAG